MRFFKKSGLHQNNLFSSTTDNFQVDKFQKSYSRADTLTHVMHLFEEKKKYSATPVVGPLPIKANGAIVLNRPPNNNSKNGTIRSLPIYLQDVPFQEEEQTIIKVEKNNTIKEETVADLAHEENKRLRQQVLLEREQYEKWRIAREKSEQELKLAQHTMKNMQRVIDRFQKIIMPPNESSKRTRRQSTGVMFAYINGGHVAESYERKIQILLNEIDAMETQETETFKKYTDQKNEFDALKRKLKYKDDTIRQLAYDLKYEQTRHL
ncbi:hypothetical protein BDF21DRAFT_407771 [Thamnidium elegans]|uniref:Uncharacterized protein n=1 Tax=Thamnidium elegans TaxID=101142 RepID=A0A8H7STI9_9FUNG|nr:hypothetical protein INT48_006738 [Thamnidium elegans]KAI8094020.1 hypothetical protein BDF21DRAFT_407771 [Thamnidium elegans]